MGLWQGGRRLASLGRVALVLLAAGLMGTSSDIYARNRPTISGNTVRADDGSLLRGPFIKLVNNIVYTEGNSTTAYTAAYWQPYKDAGFNSVRIQAAWGLGTYPGFQRQLTLDSLYNLVQVFKSLNMYVTICGSAGDYGSYNQADLQDQWNTLCPIYKDDTNVIFEIQNEPIAGPDSFLLDAAGHPRPTALKLVEIYQSMRTMAPNTLIGMWDFSMIGADGVPVYNNPTWAIYNCDPSNVVDYSNAAVVFHYYEPTKPEYVAALKNVYPVWMTESSDEGPNNIPSDPVDHDLKFYLDCELKGISWYSMDYAGGTYAKCLRIRDFLAKSGFGWAVGGGIYEAESLASTNSGEGSSTFSQEGVSGGQGVVFPAAGTNSWVQFTVPAVKAGTYRVNVYVKKFNPRGIFQLSIDGANFGPAVDAYNATELFQSIALGTKTWAANGNATFRFTVTGKNASSSGYALAIDAIELVPVTDPANASFDNSAPVPQSIPGWTESGTVDASYVSSSVAAYDGSQYLAHYSASAYSVTTSQTVTNLVNGTYVFKAWVQRQGSAGNVRLEASGFGGTTVSAAVPANLANWTQVVLPGIQVTNGQCTLAFVSQSAPAADWLRVDRAQFYRQNALVANPGFEFNESGVQSLIGWSDTGYQAAGLSSSSLAAHVGYRYLAHARIPSAAYSVFTSQTKIGIPNGTYTMKAWVQSGGTANHAKLKVSGFGGTTMTANIPTTATWTQVTIPNIPVTNGQCTFGFDSVAASGDFIRVDDVEFY